MWLMKRIEPPEKLIRDGYAQIINPERLRYARKEERFPLLLEKFYEEYWEVRLAASDEELLSELGDLREVLTTLQRDFPRQDLRDYELTYALIQWLYQVSDEQIEAAQQKKAAQFGGFSQYLVLSSPEASRHE